MIDPLSELAIRYGTDKFGYHDYTPNYHKLFKHLQAAPLRLLEIGVGGYQDADRGGQSLATWRDYFPNAQITSIDIQKKTFDLGPNVKIFQGSQIDHDFLTQLSAERGPFDIIIDDGSHQNAHVVDTFQFLFPLLAEGGIYVVEDVQTAFIPRFGGSVTLDAPNSVGLFADLFERLGLASGAMNGEIRAMERYHNMVALHKAAPGPAADLWASNAFERLPDAPRIVATDVSIPVGALGGAPIEWAKPEQLGIGIDDTDAIVLDATLATEWSIRSAMARLHETGLLVLLGAPSAALESDLIARFIEVDHREIAVNFPQKPLDDLATLIYGIERHYDGLILIKAPNDYPSNMKFDAEQPQAAAAIAEMARVLEDCDQEEGLVSYAGIMTNIHGREAARPWLTRLSGLDATSRNYFQLAAGLAQRDRELEKAENLFAAALVQYPDDAGFTLGQGSVLLALGRTEAAEARVVATLAVNPRNPNLHLLMTRIAARSGNHEQSIDHAKQAISMCPAARKPQAQIALGEAMLRAKRVPEAEATFRDALTVKTRFAPKAWRGLSTALKQQGDATGALEAAQKAAELSPQSNEFKSWAASLSA
ncbi:MAG: tetratricopeptide repeat protein [Rhodobacteraceae bacterium]|nr:tetratricopeptide repeat protein [Paracoccaceae bacterium]